MRIGKALQQEFHNRAMSACHCDVERCQAIHDGPRRLSRRIRYRALPERKKDAATGSAWISLGVKECSHCTCRSGLGCAMDWRVAKAYARILFGEPSIHLKPSI